MEKFDNRHLVSRCLNGDADAWSEFVDRFSGLVYWSIKRKLARNGFSYLMPDADEIYQGVFSSIWANRRLEGVKDRDDIEPWLVIIASNATIDYIRKRGHYTEFQARYRQEKSLPQKVVVEDVDTMRLVDEAISSLNITERAYLELHFNSGMRHREIAQIYRISVNSVSTVIARAKHKIKKYVASKKCERKDTP
ncbi:MAG: sigma-70 family RNA polymerase sigma factor [Candidatus Omnitrophica bacterium]|nr:sigma-70 family RNA polymerase sigma factor [Candidatus Omnitrophota bacterium]